MFTVDLYGNRGLDSCILYGISHDRGGRFVPFSVIFAQKLRFEE